MALRSVRGLAVASLAGGLCACSDAPMGYLHSFGPAAHPVSALGWGLIYLCSIIALVIGGLVLRASLCGRRTDDDESHAAIERSGNGLAWIYIGVGISTVLLVGITAWTLIALRQVAHPGDAAAFTIEIRAHQWWWEARYLADVPSRTFTTANELHIPVGTPVNLRLIGDDVIHSFWIPALAGKTDVVPGQINEAWIQADEPGIYRGQCTEYCGVQHAHMSAFVEAESAQAFRKWWDEQLAPAAARSAAVTAEGASVFGSRCAVCHTVRGTSAGGITGPDLTHVMSRHTIAAGTLPNSPDLLARWISDAQAIKPGSRMPKIELSQADLGAVTAYVHSLH